MMNNMLGPSVLLVGTILLLLLIGFIYIWIYIAKKQNLMGHVGTTDAAIKNTKPLSEKLWTPLLRASDYVGPTAVKYPLFFKPEKDELMLIRAGNPMDIDLTQFYGMKYVLGFGSWFFFWFYFLLGLPFGYFLLIGMPIFMFFFPNMWIKSMAQKRQEQISSSMPDFLDTVSITLQAGVSLEGALRQVTTIMKGPLSEEFQKFLQQTNLGVPRRTAFQNLLHRNSARELEVLVLSLLQGIELGVPISNIFRIQADDLRVNRGHTAKEKAAKASPKITLVATFVITPSILLLIVGLIGLNYMYNPELLGLKF